MNWLERLNRHAGPITLDAGTAEILSWAYVPHLLNNLPHRHTFFEVCLVGEWGHGRFIVQGKDYDIGPGDLFIARPGVEHQILNVDAVEMELFWVCFQWLPDTHVGTETGALLRAFTESFTLVSPAEEFHIGGLWRMLKTVSEDRPRPGQDEQIRGLTVSLLLAIAQAGAGKLAPPVVETEHPDAGDMTAKAAVRYIHDNLERPLSLPEIADQVHVSARHLCRLFARFTGTSPSAYIARARLDRAAGLLLRTELPLKEVAASTGFTDIHYFTRLFTREFGCSPGAYRRKGGPLGVPKIQKPGALV